VSNDFSNVEALPPRGEASRGVVETLVDVLKDCEAQLVSDVLVITRDAEGFLDFSMSSQSSGDVAEMAMFLNRGAGDLIEAMNKRYRKHIITLEDPIEYSLRSVKSAIEQREIGHDCPSFASGLRYLTMSMISCCKPAFCAAGSCAVQT